MTALRLGTRRSALALAQSAAVAAALTAATGRDVELVEIMTEGDAVPVRWPQLGGAGVFISALRDALLAGDIDLAVHSLKDLPTAPPAGLVIAAVPPREDPRDVLVARDGLALGELPAGSRVGTGSPRRRRSSGALGQASTSSTSAATSTAACARSRTAERGRRRPRPRRAWPGWAGSTPSPRCSIRPQMLPAPGQGALAVECRSDREDVVDALATLDDTATGAASRPSGRCSPPSKPVARRPVGALADVSDADGPDAEVYLRAVVVAVDGSESVRLSATGAPHEAEAVGRRLAAALLAEGADGLMGARVP